MTRETRTWLKAHWWEVGIALLAVGGWSARVEAAIGQVHDVARDHAIVEGLGRLSCLKDRLTATAAGLPCGELLGDR